MRSGGGGGGGGLKNQNLNSNFCPHVLNSGAILFCVGDFYPQNSLTPCGEKKIDWV